VGENESRDGFLTMPEFRAWENVAERKIRQAIADGVFENLPGSGQPISLEEDPFEPADLRMAHRLLRHNGFAPDWIEDQKDLDAAIGILRRNLVRAWARHGEPAETRRRRLLEGFRDQFAELNRRILAFNLKAPSVTVQKPLLEADREIARASE
jgi:DnaJ family protein C protein 28